MGGGICLEWLPPLEKSSASLGKGWVGKYLVTNGVALCPVSHTGAAQWAAGNHR